MEILAFYSLSIFVAMIMSIGLGLFGLHLVGRRQSVETLMIGQLMQFGLLIGALFKIIFHLNIGDGHDGHIQMLFSFLISFVFYFLIQKLVKKFEALKNEINLIIIILSISLGQIIMGFVPQIESFYTQSFTGDIVTASHSEAYFLLFGGVLCLIYLLKRSKKIISDTIDYGLYGLHLDIKAPLFELVLFVLMSLSLHIFGLLFTLGMMLIPAFFINSQVKLHFKTSVLFITFLNLLGVLIGFCFNILSYDFPTSPAIILSTLVLYLLLSLYLKLSVK